MAFAITYGVRNTIASFVGNETVLGTRQLFVTSHEAIVTGLILLGVGALVGVFGSAFAIRRFLAV